MRQEDSDPNLISLNSLELVEVSKSILGLLIKKYFHQLAFRLMESEQIYDS